MRSRYQGIESSWRSIEPPPRRSCAVSSSGTTRSGARDAALALQQLHRQHVGGHRRHRDDVGAERVGGGRRAIIRHGLEHVHHRRVGLEIGRHQRPPAAQLADEEVLPIFLAPLRVRAQAERPGHGVERRGVAAGVLPDVEPREGQAERGEPPQDVGEAALGNDRVAGRAQRPIAQRSGAARSSASR